MKSQANATRTIVACTCLSLVASLFIAPVVWAQSVCLPAPRLLTTMPMGGQAGESVEITISGDYLEGADQLSFSHPGIQAEPLVASDGAPVPNKYVVSIADDCPAGIHEARIMTRLGISTSRVFSVDTLTETVQRKPNTSLETAMPLQLNSICNAVMTKQSVDYYTFEAKKDQRIVVDCAARGIDSKLKPVLIIADDTGADLLVQRRGGALDFTAPEAGKYVIKVHELTYNGGPYYFYRLAVREALKGQDVPRLPSTQAVSAFSWPPHGLTDDNLISETEPNNGDAPAQQIALPCDISGSFFPAADVDTFEFTAKKGEVWWVEVASERLGLPTDPSVVVQHVAADGTVSDLAELGDIASPVKVSSNGYSYDGPPYNAGSSDVLGRFEIKQDGVHRLQLRDLFGGTRSDSRNVYRLIVRRATPDFALVAWALHMNLRNGDRNALSKPIALRGGATMPLEVVVVRRDGFDGEIELFMEDLPSGVTASGLRIPAGQSRGIMLVSAEAGAPRGLTRARFYGTATIGDERVSRPCRFASMQWPVPNAWSEIPNPRLLADVPVSVSDSEQAPITVGPAENKVWEIEAGQKLSIPLVQTRRCEFSGATISLKTFGTGFERTPTIEIPLNSDAATANLDLAALKTPPGDYVIAFYGSAVAKYRYNVEAVADAQQKLQQEQQRATALETEVKRFADAAREGPDQGKPEAQNAAREAFEKYTKAKAAVAAADKRLKAMTAKAKAKDIVDIVVSQPIFVRVNPASKVK